MDEGNSNGVGTKHASSVAWRNSRRQRSAVRGRRALLATLLIAVLLLTSCLGPGKEERSVDGVKFNRVTSENRLVALSAPADWRVNSARPAGKGKLLLIVGPESDGYRANLQVGTEKLQGVDLVRYIRQYEANTKKEPGAVQLRQTASSPFRGGVRKRYRLRLQSGPRSLDLTADIYYEQRGDRFFVVQFVSDSQAYSRLAPLFNRSLNTLEIKEF